MTYKKYIFIVLVTNFLSLLTFNVFIWATISNSLVFIEIGLILFYYWRIVKKSKARPSREDVYLRIAGGHLVLFLFIWAHSLYPKFDEEKFNLNYFFGHSIIASAYREEYYTRHTQNDEEETGSYDYAFFRVSIPSKSYLLQNHADYQIQRDSDDSYCVRLKNEDEQDCVELKFKKVYSARAAALYGALPYIDDKELNVYSPLNLIDYFIDFMLSDAVYYLLACVIPAIFYPKNSVILCQQKNVSTLKNSV